MNIEHELQKMEQEIIAQQKYLHFYIIKSKIDLSILFAQVKIEPLPKPQPEKLLETFKIAKAYEWFLISIFFWQT